MNHDARIAAFKTAVADLIEGGAVDDADARVTVGGNWVANLVEMHPIVGQALKPGFRHPDRGDQPPVEVATCISANGSIWLVARVKP